MTTTFATELKLPLSKILKQHPDLASVSMRTLFRWTQRPTRGAILEFTRVGGRVHSSIEAVNRFLAQLNDTTTSAPGPTLRSPHERSRASDAAAAELDAVGA